MSEAEHRRLNTGDGAPFAIPGLCLVARLGIASIPFTFDKISNGQSVKTEGSPNDTDHGQQEIAAHLLLHRLHLERVKILSYERAGSEDLAQLKLALRRVAALERYEGRIFADRKRRASKIKGDCD